MTAQHSTAPWQEIETAGLERTSREAHIDRSMQSRMKDRAAGWLEAELGPCLDVIQISIFFTFSPSY